MFYLCKIGDVLEMYQHLLDPPTHGYYLVDYGDILPTTTNVPPAPQAIVELLRCQCKAQRTIHRSSYQKHNLACTDLYLCGTDCENDADCNVDYDTQDSDEYL